MRDFFAVVDLLVGGLWSFTLLEVAPIVFSGKIAEDLFSSASGIINFMLAVAGFIYLVARLLHFIRISKINIDIRKEELIAKKNQNFYHKYNNEFVDPFKETK